MPDTAPPYLTVLSPEDGAAGVAIDAPVSFSLSDNTQVLLSTVRLYVNTLLVYDGVSFQAGWGGTITPNASFGYDFTLQHTSIPLYFPYGLYISVRVVAADAAANSLDTCWGFTTEARYKKASMQIKALAHDVLRIYFPEPVVTSADLLLLSNYILMPITEGAQDASVRQVRTLEGDEGTTNFVDVYVTPVALDAEYRLEVRNQRTVDRKLLTSGVFVGMIAHFVGRPTKADAMRGSVARMYDAVGNRSTMTQVLMALALEDERVGGQGDLAPVPVPVRRPATFGTATYNNDDYGG